MKRYESIFYGDLSSYCNSISYSLISRKIVHDFVYFDKLILTIQASDRFRELRGFEEITFYIENYRYLYEFPEIFK